MTFSNAVSKVVSSAPVVPEVWSGAGAGGLAAAIVNLIQTYAPTAHLPSQGTIILLVTLFTSLVAYEAHGRSKSLATPLDTSAASDVPVTNATAAPITSVTNTGVHNPTT